MPDENRVFDVAKPGHSSPSATSKPIIVGHQPTMSDPMVNEGPNSADTYIETPSTKIDIHDENHEPDGHSFLVNKSEAEKPLGTESDSGSPWITPPAFGAASQDSPAPEPSPAGPEPPAEPSSPAFDEPPPDNPEPASAPSAEEPVGHVEGLHVSAPPRKNRLGLISLVILILLVGVYLVIDSGLVKTRINLPVHIFKQKKIPAVTSNTSTQTSSSSAAAALPAGFTEYKLAGTNLTFAAPGSWGQPTSSTDPGFTARSAAGKSDGTYAYLVDFAANKSVQVSVTSSKYLPPARATQYYDYLQWCNGTNDGKFYFAVLRFTTSAAKVDTPTTITCDQGPLADVTKLDALTIAQLKAKDNGGNLLGDIYVKNLSNTDLPVFRVRDTAMTNSTEIKQLLNTVKIPKTSAAASSASQ